MRKMLFTGFAPNQRFKDVLRAMKFLFLPWMYFKWIKGGSVLEAENWLKNFFGVKTAVLVDSGRSALLLGLKALKIGNGDEVVVQAYTCVVVINAIKQSGARPVYVDIDGSLNINTDDLENKITDKTKAVIVQHTFGNPADIDTILGVCSRRKIKLIEDCAHSFGAMYKGQKVGTFGDLAFFSFGSDKCVSCVRGGALVSGNNEITEEIEKVYRELPNTPWVKVLQNLLHYPIFFKGKILYPVFLGKIILALAKKMHITERVIYDCEKSGGKVDFYPAKLANALADLLLLQLNDFNLISEHRKKIAEIYEKNIANNKVVKPALSDWAIPLRYNLLTDAPDVLAVIAKKQGVILGDWYRTAVAPSDIDVNKTGYEAGACPAAENFANKSINLPTDINISEKDAFRIVNIINNY
ncbi:MAG: hypothetical protein A2301_00340 [Candidatus Magasanikbacteria bacterium RIFOXYB2_FULL_40_13]|nr:MAG: hypothetical protein A2301_00340 [Candidatus Magasanikbacteria bacterium RIFOXYB2_FULL_40_13]